VTVGNGDAPCSNWLTVNVYRARPLDYLRNDKVVAATRGAYPKYIADRLTRVGITDAARAGAVYALEAREQDRGRRLRPAVSVAGVLLRGKDLTAVAQGRLLHRLRPKLARDLPRRSDAARGSFSRGINTIGRLRSG
jgi:hypothetical protein